MDYELAKQLKDKNFPYLNCVTEDCVENPPLESLILACGDEFRKLVFHHLKPLKQSHIDKYGDGVVWSAHSNRHYTDKRFTPTWGKTPEEAVAKLWLNLTNTNK